MLVYPPGADQKAARELLSAAAPGWMAPGDAAALLGHYGIPVADAGPPRSRSAGGPGTGRGVLRVHSDPLVGPVISFGLAGLFSELFGDVATGVTPLTDRDASALLASLRAYPLLTGPPAATRPTCRRSRTRCCGCPRWSRTCRRSPRSPSTRCSSADPARASRLSPRRCG